MSNINDLELEDIISSIISSSKSNVYPCYLFTQRIRKLCDKNNNMNGFYSLFFTHRDSILTKREYRIGYRKLYE